MNIILFGPPGAGKGTQADKIVKKFNLYKVSTGDLLREEIKNSTNLGNKIKSIIDKGLLVSDNIINDLIIKVLSDKKLYNRLIFDGYPRNLDQANSFEKLLEKKKKKINFALHLVIEKDEIIKRIQKRQAEENRVDDNAEVLKSRIDVYSKETEQLIELFKKQGLLKKINGMQSIENVSNDMNKFLDEND